MDAHGEPVTVPVDTEPARTTPNPEYTLYHPRWYRRRVPIFWWLGSPAYTRFIARELTSIFVAYGTLVLLVHVWSASRGDDAYAAFQEVLRHPVTVGWHVVVLMALLFHSVTWLDSAPQALVLRLRGRRVPSRWVLLAHYALWAAASAAVLGLLLVR